MTINAAQAVTAMFASAPPNAPVITSAIPGNGQATLTFAVTPVPGAAPITGYTATCGGITKSAPASPITLTGLTNDVVHACSVLATNSAGPGPASASVNVTPSAAVVTALIGVQSRKTHGAAGVFDLPVNVNEPINGAVTVEPRSIGAGHLVVFQFNTNVTAANYTVVDGNGVTIAPASFTLTGNEVSLLFTALADKSRLAIAVTGVNGTLNSSASIGFLVGDVNGSRNVTSGDTSAVKSRSGWVVDGTNFFFNISASGAIGAGDIATVKTRVGNTLP